jgi:hypothetical protein
VRLAAAARRPAPTRPVTAAPVPHRAPIAHAAPTPADRLAA